MHIYLKEFKAGNQIDVCTSKFVAILFTVAKRWEQSKCLLTDEWIRKILYIYTHTHTYIYIHIYIYWNIIQS